MRQLIGGHILANSNVSRILPGLRPRPFHRRRSLPSLCRVNRGRRTIQTVRSQTRAAGNRGCGEFDHSPLCDFLSLKKSSELGVPSACPSFCASPRPRLVSHSRLPSPLPENCLVRPTQYPKLSFRYPVRCLTRSTNSPTRTGDWSSFVKSVAKSADFHFDSVFLSVVAERYRLSGYFLSI